MVWVSIDLSPGVGSCGMSRGVLGCVSGMNLGVVTRRVGLHGNQVAPALAVILSSEKWSWERRKGNDV